MDAIDHRVGLAFERLGRGDVGGDHEILDHAVRVEPLAQGDLGDLAVLVEHDAALGQIELERVARLARGVEQLPRRPQVAQLRLFA